jgi:hypothetical protein
VIIVTIITGAHPFQDTNVAVKFEKVDKAEVCDLIMLRVCVCVRGGGGGQARACASARV